LKALKVLIKTLICIVALAAVVVGGYVIYLMAGYERIADGEPSEINGVSFPELATSEEMAIIGVIGDPYDDHVVEQAMLKQGKEYTAVTFNIGFGAYDQDFSFFMDKGLMADGAETVGTSSRAKDETTVIYNTQTAAAQVLAQHPDIVLFQEVDVKADRSHGVDQVSLIRDAFIDDLKAKAGTADMYGSNQLYSAFAVNFHTSYLCYPPTKPIGKIEKSGILTLSRYGISTSTRRSLPVDDGFPTKFFDLDRCFQVNYMSVQKSDGTIGKLVLINLHTSAYDEGGVIRKEQMKMLTEVMAEEYEKGNWVIAGGDFNHAIAGSETKFMNGMQMPDWVQPFDEDMLPAGFTMLYADNADSVATDRDSSIPYIPGTNYEVILDGFMVSDNVQASTSNLDLEYLVSDHNPVRMKFILL
jgi:endonuclease/exonuclease/phosphatase family metal-dependent hydrolase